mmetsp:Transcript_95199/g.226661  ORF Transcript_95199/g.226661 Transcript_95199/m.226661 type:complete len:203 (-) Transcript_95199:545-1153(-)
MTAGVDTIDIFYVVHLGQMPPEQHQVPLGAQTNGDLSDEGLRNAPFSYVSIGARGHHLPTDILENISKVHGQLAILFCGNWSTVLRVRVCLQCFGGLQTTHDRRSDLVGWYGHWMSAVDHVPLDRLCDLFAGCHFQRILLLFTLPQVIPAFSEHWSKLLEISSQSCSFRLISTQLKVLAELLAACQFGLCLSPVLPLLKPCS